MSFLIDASSAARVKTIGSVIEGQAEAQAEADRLGKAVVREMEHRLRAEDTAILLPGAHQSQETCQFKNAVVALHPTAPSTPSIFSETWGHGISAVPIASNKLERFFSLSPEEQARLLDQLAESIPNVACDFDASIGPPLVQEEQRDKEPWSAGFDSSSCCLGLYKSEEEADVCCETAPGTRRCNNEYFLVCKAGAGRTETELDEQIALLIQDGGSTEEIFGPESRIDSDMRWTVSVGRRNRGRLLYQLACTLFVEDAVDTMVDSRAHPSSAATQLVMPQYDCCSTSIRKVKNEANATWVLYANAIDTETSQGVITCSNVASGFWVMREDTVRTGRRGWGPSCRVKNEAYNALPFGSMRISTKYNLLSHANSQKPLGRHADDEWLRSHFYWKRPVKCVQGWGMSKETALRVTSMLPVQLWGTHASSTWFRSSRVELGVDGMLFVAMRPSFVVLAGTEPDKLRGLAESIAAQTRAGHGSS